MGFFYASKYINNKHKLFNYVTEEMCKHKDSFATINEYLIKKKKDLNMLFQRNLIKKLHM